MGASVKKISPLTRSFRLQLSILAVSFPMAPAASSRISFSFSKDSCHISTRPSAAIPRPGVGSTSASSSPLPSPSAVRP